MTYRSMGNDGFGKRLGPDYRLIGWAVENVFHVSQHHRLFTVDSQHIGALAKLQWHTLSTTTRVPLQAFLGTGVVVGECRCGAERSRAAGEGAGRLGLSAHRVVVIGGQLCVKGCFSADRHCAMAVKRASAAAGVFGHWCDGG